MQNIFEDHPLLLTGLSFLIVTLPQWISAVWGLWSTEPLAVVVQRRARAMNFSTFSPYLITAPLGLLMFSLVLYFTSEKRKLAFDYSYGLALERVYLGYDDSKKPPPVQLGLVLANAADGPLAYEVEHFEVIVEGRTKAEPVFKNYGGVIPKGKTSTFFYPSFGEELPKGKDHLDGLIRFTILYGHPEVGMFRKASKELSVSLRLGAKTGIAYLITKESDEPIKK